MLRIYLDHLHQTWKFEVCVLNVFFEDSHQAIIQIFVQFSSHLVSKTLNNEQSTMGILTEHPNLSLHRSDTWHVFFLVANVPQNPQIHGHKKNVKMRFKTCLNHEITVRTPHFDWDRPNLIYLKVACFRSQKWVLSQLCHIQIVKHPGKKHTKIIDQYTEITYYPSLSFSLSIIIIIHP